MDNNYCNPFATSVRALGLYDRLKKDVEEETSDVLHSLPQFVRIALIDREAGWYNEVNRYDLLVPIMVHDEFSILTLIGTDVRACRTVKPLQKHKKLINESVFRTSPLIELEDESFTVQDFVLAIAYHGTFHWKPTPDRERLGRLYVDFVQAFPAAAFQMAVEVGTCLIQSFEEVYRKSTGDNNAYSSVYDRQPEFVAHESGRSYGRFLDSYLQLPIRAQVRRGIRVCLEIQLEQRPSRGFVFSYGHRHTDRIMLTCQHVPTYIIVQTNGSRSGGVNQTIKLPISDSMRQDPFKIEVALYEGGQLAVAVNEILSGLAKIPRHFTIYDGKLMIGSDLNGEKNGSFLESCCTVEAIDKRYRLHHVFRGGTRSIGDFPCVDLPPNVLRRPAIPR